MNNQNQAQAPYVLLISKHSVSSMLEALERAGHNVVSAMTPRDFFDQIDSYRNNPPSVIVTAAYFIEHPFTHAKHRVRCAEGDHVPLILETLPTTHVVAYSHNVHMDHDHVLIGLGDRFTPVKCLKDFRKEIVPVVDKLLGKRTEPANTEKTSPIVASQNRTPEKAAPEKALDIALISRTDGHLKQKWLAAEGHNVKLFETPKAFFQDMDSHQKNPPSVIVTAAFFLDADFWHKGKPIDCESGYHIKHILQELPTTPIVAYTVNNRFSADSWYDLPTEYRLDVKNAVGNFREEIIPAVNEILGKKNKPAPQKPDIALYARNEPIPEGQSPTRVIFLIHPRDSAETVQEEARLLTSTGHDVYVVGNPRIAAMVSGAFKKNIDGFILPPSEEPNLSYVPLNKKTVIKCTPGLSHSVEDFAVIVGNLNTAIRKKRGHIRYRTKGRTFDLT